MDMPAARLDLQAMLEQHEERLLRRKSIPIFNVTDTEPVAEGSSKSKAEFFSTAVSLAKGMIGATVLTLPDGVTKAGSISAVMSSYVFVTVGNAVLALIVASYCKALDAWSYSALVRRVYGHRAALCIDSALACNCFTACVAYLLVMREHVSRVLDSLAGFSHPSEALHAAYLVVAVCFIYPLTLLPDLRSLRFSSYLGMACIYMTLAFVMYHALATWEVKLPRCGFSCTAREVLGLPRPFSWTGLAEAAALFLNATMFTYTIPHFFEEYHDRRVIAFAGPVLVALFSTLITATAFAILGFARFGVSKEEGNLLVQFGDSPAALFVWLLMAVQLGCTYPITFAPLRSAVEDLVGAEQRNARWLTATLVAATAVVSLFVSDLTAVTALKGAVFGVFLCIVFPALLLLRFPLNWSPAWMQRAMAAGFIVIGLAVTIIELWLRVAFRPGQKSTIVAGVPDVYRRFGEAKLGEGIVEIPLPYYYQYYYATTAPSLLKSNLP